MVIVHPINMAMKITQHVGVARQRVRNTDLSPQPFWVHLLSAVVWINHYCCLSRDYVHNKFSGPEIQVLGMDVSEFIFFHLGVKKGLPPMRPPKCPSGSLTRGKGLSIWIALVSLFYPILLSKIKMQRLSLRSHAEGSILLSGRLHIYPQPTSISSQFVPFNLYE